MGSYRPHFLKEVEPSEIRIEGTLGTFMGLFGPSVSS